MCGGKWADSRTSSGAAANCRQLLEAGQDTGKAITRLVALQRRAVAAHGGRGALILRRCRAIAGFVCILADVAGV